MRGHHKDYYLMELYRVRPEPNSVGGLQNRYIHAQTDYMTKCPIPQCVPHAKRTKSCPSRNKASSGQPLRPPRPHKLRTRVPTKGNHTNSKAKIERKKPRHQLLPPPTPHPRCRMFLVVYLTLDNNQILPRNNKADNTGITRLSSTPHISTASANPATTPVNPHNSHNASLLVDRVHDTLPSRVNEKSKIESLDQ
jgi:hypothetical protein